MNMITSKSEPLPNGNILSTVTVDPEPANGNVGFRRETELRPLPDDSYSTAAIDYLVVKTSQTPIYGDVTPDVMAGS